MAANKPTHTVRTVSRRVSTSGGGASAGSLNDDFSATPRAVEAKKNLLRKMLIVFGVVIFLLVLLLAFDFLNEKNAASTPQTSSPSKSTEIPAINLDKVDDLKTRLDAAQQEQQAQQAAQPAQPEPQPAPQPQPQQPPVQQPDGVSPERTPFDDLNFVEEEPEAPEEPQDPNAPIVEQTITETGETILRISPQRTKTAQKTPSQTAQQRQQISQRQQQIQQYQQAQQQARREIARAEQIAPENSANVPMKGSSAPGLPTQATARPTRMPSNRFHVQAGIFVENERARTLYQRLVSAGIPTVLESRVQVGPFTTRREAEGARQQLKSMGIDSIVVAPSS